MNNKWLSISSIILVILILGGWLNISSKSSHLIFQIVKYLLTDHILKQRKLGDHNSSKTFIWENGIESSYKDFKLNVFSLKPLGFSDKTQWTKVQSLISHFFLWTKKKKKRCLKKMCVPSPANCAKHWKDFISKENCSSCVLFSH